MTPVMKMTVSKYIEYFPMKSRKKAQQVKAKFRTQKLTGAES